MSFLDIGCGEGWALKHFADKNWRVKGLDYSEAGIQNHNPQFLDQMDVCDIFAGMDSLIKQKEKFQCILLDNVLEHLLDPLLMLEKLKQLSDLDTVLIIEVPNDFSDLQRKLIEANKISREFWVVSPDHISYFNKKGLRNLCSEKGWDEKAVLTSFPIDLFLLNPLTNYIEKKDVGPICHDARMDIEFLINSNDKDKVFNFYSSLADLGLGRDIIGFYSLKKNI
jgi:2-polyprenyl-3-methyl-5-hydroxy-6-metoxy-1,4-benzoquinol methylase